MGFKRRRPASDSVPMERIRESTIAHYKVILHAYQEAVVNFNKRWDAWHRVCLTRAAAGISPDRCTEPRQFFDLTSLGPKIFLFVLNKLADDPDGNNFYGVFVYNTIEADSRCRAQPDEENPATSTEALMRLRDRILRINFHRCSYIARLVVTWGRRHGKNPEVGSSHFFTVTEEYIDLVDVGPSVIPFVMVGYRLMPMGHWYQLLHEVIHGHQTGGYEHDKMKLHKKNVKWFNEEDHDKALYYTPGKVDRFLMGEPTRVPPLDPSRDVGRTEVWCIEACGET